MHTKPSHGPKLLIGLALLVPACASLRASDTTPASAQAIVHDQSFFRAIAEQDGKVPADADVLQLVHELESRLGDPDPVWRDDLAYSLITAWTYRDHLLPDGELRALVARLQLNLRRGIGQTGDDSVLLRSFSALTLSTLVALDAKQPFLERDQARALLDAALAYLADERDVRGYDERLGWLHSSAHTADLLKFLVRGRWLERGDQVRVLQAISGKLGVPATGVYTHGEDERLARTVLELVRREDFDATAFQSWLDRYPPLAKALWAEKPLSTARLHELQNVKHLLQAVHVLLAAESGETERAAAAGKAVMSCLGKL